MKHRIIRNRINIQPSILHPLTICTFICTFTYITLLFLVILSLSLVDTKMFFNVWPPLKCTSTPCFLQMFFKLSPIPCEYGTTMWHLAGYLVLGVCFSSLCWCFLNIFLIAHFGYLQCPSTCSRCCSSSLANSGVEQMVGAV